MVEAGVGGSAVMINYLPGLGNSRQPALSHRLSCNHFFFGTSTQLSVPSSFQSIGTTIHPMGSG